MVGRETGQAIAAQLGFAMPPITYHLLRATEIYDIASRGLDIPGIEHIINFDIPQTVEEYIHRAGRTARMEALGLVSTIATWLD